MNDQEKAEMKWILEEHERYQAILRKQEKEREATKAWRKEYNRSIRETGMIPDDPMKQVGHAAITGGLIGVGLGALVSSRRRHQERIASSAEEDPNYWPPVREHYGLWFWASLIGGAGIMAGIIYLVHIGLIGG